MTSIRNILLASGFAVAAGMATAAIAQESQGIVHVEDARSMDIAPMEVEGVNAYLEDVVSTGDPDSPLTCGFFRLEASEAPLTYEYDYDETKIILDGVITISDGITTIDAEEGDVVLLPKGSSITFTTESEGTAYVCGARLSE